MLAMTACTTIPLVVLGTPPSPATCTRRATVGPAPIAPSAQPIGGLRVSQIRAGAIAWYWSPAAADEVPNHPFASRSTLILPTEFSTHTAGFGPLGPGPSLTNTRFASIAPATTLMVEALGACVHVPDVDVGKTVTYVFAVPETAVRLRTAASAVPSDGIAPVTVTSMGDPATTAPWALHAGVGEVLRVSQTRDGRIGWN